MMCSLLKRGCGRRTRGNYPDGMGKSCSFPQTSKPSSLFTSWPDGFPLSLKRVLVIQGLLRSNGNYALNHTTNCQLIPRRYLYGRGVSDNKGPILATACAAANLRQQRELDVDVVMLIEGEEEAGSRGFASTVRKHKVRP
jgi:hypothetical protein